MTTLLAGGATSRKMGAFLALFVIVTIGFGRAAVMAWERLKQQEKKFRTVLESSPDPLILTEANGKHCGGQPAGRDAFWLLR